METKKLFKKRIILLAILGVLPLQSYALPGSPTVKNGTVDITTSGNTMTIKNTPGSIINWNSFSIANGEMVKILQNSSSSTILNRVVGVNPSQILGALQSNGRVFLINPNGIIFGKGAVIDVGGLVASTLNMTDADFLNGKYRFTGGLTAGDIINDADIKLNNGSVVMIAKNITNNGIINTANGDVILGAGQEVELVDLDNPNMSVGVMVRNNDVNITQLLKDNGNDIYKVGFNVINKGNINAMHFVQGENGRVAIRATNSVIADTTSDISAKNIEMKGDVAGLYAGKITTPEKGFVETSGGYLDVGGVNFNLGKGTTWLLDPTNIEIKNGGSNFGQTGSNPVTIVGNLSGTSVIDPSLLNLQLKNNVDVIVDSYLGPGGGVGNVTITDPIIVSGNANPVGKLTFNVAGNYQQNAEINLSGGIYTSGDLQITAAGSINIGNNNTFNLTAKNIILTGGNNIGNTIDSAVTVNANSLKVGGKGFSNFGTINLNGTGDVLTADTSFYGDFKNASSISLTTVGGNVNLDMTGSPGSGYSHFYNNTGKTLNVLNGNISIKATGEISNNGVINITNGENKIYLEAGDDPIVSANSFIGGSINTSNSASIDAIVFNFKDVTNMNNFNITSNGGNWQIYTAIEGSTFGVPQFSIFSTLGALKTSNEGLFGQTYGNGVNQILPGSLSGNNYIFSNTNKATYTITDQGSNTVTKTYGDTLTTPGNSFTLQYSSSDTGHLFRSDWADATTVLTAGSVDTKSSFVASEQLGGTVSGYDPTANASTYTGNLGLAQSTSIAVKTGYTLDTTDTADLVINKKELIIGFNNKSSTYGDASLAALSSTFGDGFGGFTFIAGDNSTNLTSIDDAHNLYVDGGGNVLSSTANAGVYSYTSTGFTDNNYVMATTGNTLTSTYTVNRANVTVTPTQFSAGVNYSKVYGDADPTFNSGFYSTNVSTLANGTTVSLSGNLSRTAGENVATNTYQFLQGGITNTANPNYNITFSSTPVYFDIIPKSIAVAVNTSSSQYGNPIATLTDNLASLLVNGDSVTSFTGGLSTGATSSSVVGQYNIGGSYTGNNNYAVTVTSNPTAYTVSARPITVSVNTSSSQYGNPIATLTDNLASLLVNGDSVTSFTGGLSTGATSSSVVGQYNIGGSYTGNNNYAVTVTSNPTAYTVSARPITVSVNTSSSQYGNPIATLTDNLASLLVNGDSVTSFTGGLSTGATSSSVVGQYNIGGSYTGNNNYAVTVTSNPTAYTVSARPITVSVNTSSSQYGNPIATLTDNLASLLVNGDSVTSFTGGLSTGATSSSVVGQYNITGNYSNSNYNILGYSGSANAYSVNPKDVTINALNQTITLGQSVNLGMGSYNVVGLVGTDTLLGTGLSSSQGLTPTTLGNFTGNFTNLDLAVPNSNYNLLAFNAGDLTVKAVPIITSIPNDLVNIQSQIIADLNKDVGFSNNIFIDFGLQPIETVTMSSADPLTEYYKGGQCQ